MLKLKTAKIDQKTAKIDQALALRSSMRYNAQWRREGVS